MLGARGYLARVGTRTNITPDRSSVKRVVRPNDRVNKGVEARQCSPDHIIACSGVPGFQMPGQGDEHEHEAEGGDDWEEGVKVASHVLLRWLREGRGNRM